MLVGCFIMRLYPRLNVKEMQFLNEYFQLFVIKESHCKMLELKGGKIQNVPQTQRLLHYREIL